jgi:hypothetical protein
MGTNHIFPRGFVILFLLLSNCSFMTLEERMEIQSWEEYAFVKEKDFADMSIITLEYSALFLSEFERERAETILDLLLEYQENNGAISDGINAKLCTGLAVFVLTEGYRITEEERYKEAALKGGDFLIEEIEEWKTINEIKITEISQDARHRGVPQSSMECYYWTSPNDLGIMALGLAALAQYDTQYGIYAEELGDALYRMQLDNGGWYDGYTQIPIRRDQSSWYVVMAMLGLWGCSTNVDNEAYRESLREAGNWMNSLWDGGSVYDIHAYEENYETAFAEGRVIGTATDRRFDYKRYEETDKRDYVARSDYTSYYGEHSFLLANAVLINCGMAVDRENLKATFRYILNTKDEDPSNWFLLSLWLIRTRSNHKCVQKE